MPATFIHEQQLVAIQGGWFDAASHSYFNSKNVRVPGTTHTLERAGLVCYDGIPQAILEHKAEVGTAAHAATHYLDEGDLELATVDDEVMPYLEAWMKFRKESSFVANAIEQRGIAVASGMEYGYTFDRDGVLDGKRTLIEIKCTAGIEISWGPQLAAYEAALRMADGVVRQRVAVHLKPTGEYSLLKFSNVKDYQVFHWALGLIVWRQSMGKGYGYGSR